MEAPANWEQILNDYASLEVENSRLRQLLDEIRRRAPKVYDEAAQEREDA